MPWERDDSGRLLLEIELVEDVGDVDVDGSGSDGDIGGVCVVFDIEFRRRQSGSANDDEMNSDFTLNGSVKDSDLIFANGLAVSKLCIIIISI